MFLWPETIVASFLHIIAFICKAFINPFSKCKLMVLLIAIANVLKKLHRYITTNWKIIVTNQWRNTYSILKNILKITEKQIYTVHICTCQATPSNKNQKKIKLVYVKPFLLSNHILCKKIIVIMKKFDFKVLTYLYVCRSAEFIYAIFTVMYACVWTW